MLCHAVVHILCDIDQSISNSFCTFVCYNLVMLGVVLTLHVLLVVLLSCKAEV